MIDGFKHLSEPDVVVLVAFFGMIASGLYLLARIAFDPGEPPAEPCTPESQEAIKWFSARRWDETAQAMVYDTPPPEHLAPIIARMERREAYFRRNR